MPHCGTLGGLCMHRTLYQVGASVTPNQQPSVNCRYDSVAAALGNMTQYQQELTHLYAPAVDCL